MVWQHDKVNRLMDHQTNVGGGKGERRGEERGEQCARAQQEIEEPDARWSVLIYGEVRPDQ